MKGDEEWDGAVPTNGGKTWKQITIVWKEKE